MRRLLKSPALRPTIADVEQISLPMRIALAATLVFAALWLVVLRPKPVDTSTPAPTPAAAKPSTSSSDRGTNLTGRPGEAAKAVESANATSAAREKAADAVGSTRTQRSTPSRSKTSTATKPAAPAKKAAKAGSAPARVKATGAQAVVADVKAHRTVVLLFWAMNSADDREVKRAVDAVDTHGGTVRVHTARMRDLPAYDAITQDSPVTTSPTVFVIDRNAEAHVISGLTTTREIDTLVRSVLKRK